MRAGAAKCGEEGVSFCLAQLLRRQAAARPDAPCLSFEGLTLSFKELDARSNRVAQALLASGVNAGDRVAVIARNSPLFYELTFGCAKMGAILVPINWRLSLREITGILTDAQPALVIAGTEQAPLVPERFGQAGRHLDADTHYDGWRDRCAALDPMCPASPETTLLLLYTSGTTGLPKGVEISHRNLSYTERIAREIWGFTVQSVNLVAMPLFHIGGLGYGMMALSQGGHTVLMQQPVPQPVLEAIRRYGVTHAFFVPTVIQSLLAVEGVEAMGLKSLARIIYGAAPISETLLSRAIEVFGCGFNHAYGMTETAGTVVTLQPEDHDPGGEHAGRLRSCGLPLPWVELGLFDPSTAQPVATGAIGEIWIRSGMTMKGYWNKPAETAATLRADGWLRTGDAANQDEQGYVYIRDRFKDMIVSGGENVFPAEVENVISEHRGIAEVAVIGVPHARWGETVKAVVVLRAGAQLSPAELIAFTRERLAHFKCPTSVDILQTLPKSASGKILKRELRAMIVPSAQGAP